MSRDPHNVIRKLAVHVGWPDDPNANINQDDLCSVHEGAFVMSPPIERAQFIENLDTIISNDEGSLEKKSQLVDLRRRCARIHEGMRRVGR
jgi:hypothetical protein